MIPIKILFFIMPWKAHWVQYGRQGIGKHLMECVLNHYPDAKKREFFLITRTYNTAAIGLYGTRLNFTPIDPAQFGLDERFIGFSYGTDKRNEDGAEVRNGPGYGF